MPNGEAKSIVFVVGAGASKEAQLPTGAELKQQIAQILDIRYQRGNQTHGDAALAHAFRMLPAHNHDGKQFDADALYRSGLAIRDAMPQAVSIDNFIDAHRGNAVIERCGKLAIARCILQAERDSSLYVKSGQNRLIDFFRANEATWFNTLFQLLVDGCQKSDLPQRLGQTAIVTFNYDRCIEHFLHHALQNYYRVDQAEATNLMSNLDIYHPYGFLGRLPWQDRQQGVPYGDEITPQSLIEMSARIKTFTEGTDAGHSDIVAIRQSVRLARSIVYLGFAFNRQNLQLLYAGPNGYPPPRQTPVYGTAVGISESNVHAIRDELVAIGGHPRDQIFLRREVHCANLIPEFSRNLARF